ncbi:MAG: GAF domain-containing protein [Pseudomonadota bacterium]
MSIAPHWEAQIASAESLSALGGTLAACVRERTSAERFNVGRLDLSRYLFFDEYVAGHNVPGRKRGHERTLTGTVVEAAIAAGGGTYMGHADRDVLTERFPNFGPVYDSGIRAMLAVTLVTEDVPFAALVLASSLPEAYDDDTLSFVRSLGEAANPLIGRFLSRT